MFICNLAAEYEAINIYICIIVMGSGNWVVKTTWMSQPMSVSVQQMSLIMQTAFGINI